MLAVNQAKTFAADVGLMATERAMRLAGGRGILKELPLERWHRDSLAGPVMPPSNDRCLETAGKLLCGLRAATLEFQRRPTSMRLEVLRRELAQGAETIQGLVAGVSPAEARVRPSAEAWSILEVVAHLLDEEREDFRPRLDLVLHRPNETWTPIDPAGWVTARGYNDRELGATLSGFLAERERSRSGSPGSPPPTAAARTRRPSARSPPGTWPPPGPRTICCTRASSSSCAAPGCSPSPRRTAPSTRATGKDEARGGKRGRRPEDHLHERPR